MGLLSGPDTNIGRATLDVGAQHLIDNQEKMAKQTDQQLADQTMAGAQQAGANVINGTPQSLKLGASALGENYDPAMSEAIANKVAKTHERDVNQLQRQTELNSKLQKNQQLQQRSAMWQKEATFKNNYSKMVLQAQMNKEKAKSEVLGGIGSAIGTVAGFALAGPAGGMAGSMIGKGMAGAAGGGGGGLA